MGREEVFKQVEEIFRAVFDDEKLRLTDATNASDIEDWDSLAQVNLLVAIERQFGVKFSVADIGGLKNVGDMVDLTLRSLR